jgi:hypothetical protein
MDISIQNIKSYVFDLKTESLRIKRANEILAQEMTITEKVDGTKLTLVRTSKTDPDYTKNWIVAYKGQVLGAKEFAHISDKEKQNITKTSIGRAQYSLIFDHLAKINSKAGSIPSNTEFSVEFAQNKDTLTRTYEKLGGMFLRSYGKVDYRIVAGKLYTEVVGEEVTDYTSVKKMADMLEVATFPIMFQGKVTPENINKYPSIASKMTGVDWENPLDVLKKFEDALLSIQSTLGGKMEGVVLKLSDGRFFKFVQSDQYNRESGARAEKQAALRLDPEAKTPYFQLIRDLIYKIMRKVGTEGKTEEDIISDINFYVANNEPSLKNFFEELTKLSGGKRTMIGIRDDIHDTIVTILGNETLLTQNKNTVALIPMGAKPFHKGHFELIQIAAKECDNVIVFGSLADRKQAGEFPIDGKAYLKFWHDMFIPILPKNVKFKFSDKPILAVYIQLRWFEQSFVQDKIAPPTIRIYSDPTDLKDNWSDEVFMDPKRAGCPTLFNANKIERKEIVRGSMTTDISGTKMRQFLQNNDKESFMKNLPPVTDKQKEEIWNTLVSAKPKEVKESNPYAALAEELINKLATELLVESGRSVAAVDPKTPKTVNGQPAQATTKLKIVDPQGKDIHSKVSKDVKDLIYVLNERFGFWKKNNPHIENGFIFNGSSQYLMDPNKFGVLSKYKDSFGDIDVIIPKTKLASLAQSLDKFDDNNPEWTPTESNRFTSAFNYVGRTKSFASIPDQLFTLWYYNPTKQVVQIDFEGDDMFIDAAGYEKPSEWIKFSKDSPWEDLTVGIKGVAGVLMLRALARATSVLSNAVVLTPASVKKVESGAVTELTDKEVTRAVQHSLPSRYTLNPGGTGIRKAYEFVKTMPYKGKMVDAYRFVEAKETKPEDRITDISKIFEALFGVMPSADEKSMFRSYQGLLRLMKKYLDKKTIGIAMNRFTEILANEKLNPNEYGAVQKATQDILGIAI